MLVTITKGVPATDMVVQCARKRSWHKLWYMHEVWWNLSIKDPLNKGHLSNEGTVCSPNHIELCYKSTSELGHLSIQGSQLGPGGALY